MNVALGPRFGAPAKHLFSGEDVLRIQACGLLVEDGKFELIGGEIIDMPSEGDDHLSLRVALTGFLYRALPGGIGLVPDGTLKLTERDWPEPDLYLYPASKPPGAVRGPDTLLVIEISDTSLAHDLGRKAELYRQCGVREYWVIDVGRRRLHVHRSDGQWPAPALPFTAELEASLVPALRVRISDLWPG